MINKEEVTLEKVRKCPCGNNKFINISNQDRFGLPFRNILCENCGLLITNPRIDNKSLPLYYNEIYHPLVVGIPKGKIIENLFCERQGEYIFKYCEEVILSLKKTSLKIIEIGCANGSNLIEIEKLCNEIGIECDLFGTEYEEENAKKALQKGVKIINSDLGVIIEEEHEFDIVILSHVLEHFAGLNKVIKQIKKILKKDGFVYVEVPGLMNKEMIKRNYHGDFIDYTVHAHMYNFNLESLKRVFEFNGFDLINGNEFVKAIFKPSRIENKNTIDSTGNHEKVLSFINDYFYKRGRREIITFRLIKINIVRFIIVKIFWGLYYKLLQDKPMISKFYLTRL